MSKLDVMHPPRPLAAMATMALPRTTAYPNATFPPTAAAPVAAAGGRGATSSIMQGTPNGAGAVPQPAAATAAAHGSVSSTSQPMSNDAAATSTSQGEPNGDASTAATHCSISSTSQGVSNAAAAADSGHAVSMQRGGIAGNEEHSQQRVCRTAWFDTLVLDCDGVLVDSERASCEALRRSVLQVSGFDIPHTFPQDFYEVFGMDVRSCVAHYKQKFNRSDWEDVTAIAKAVQDAKEHHYKDLTEAGIAAFPGAAALIQRAKDLGMAVSVGSSGAPEKIHRNLSLSGLAPLLDPQHIVSAAYVAKGKPAPDVYLECLRRLGCTNPSKALIVEDAVNGLLAAKAAGAFAVGISNSLPGPVLHPHADLVVSHHDEIDFEHLNPNTST
ncbi:HAD-like domain-containing protein [Dunaliella salina]|nr:HAD-like domain-containing protein [Dunaliella salina]|eukprot:KAF5834188.1 HAD-like domain-containing protein [Dunaliella salina]